MSHPKYITALDLKEQKRAQLSPDIKNYFDVCDKKLEFVPNVLRAYAFNEKKIAPYMAMYDELMLGESELSKLERKMIAAVISLTNHCTYCLKSYAAGVRKLAKDPHLGELMGMTCHIDELDDRQRALLDFVVKFGENPKVLVESDRQILRDQGFSDEGIWDICSVVGFFSMINNLTSGVDLKPNAEYHSTYREDSV